MLAAIKTELSGSEKKSEQEHVHFVHKDDVTRNDPQRRFLVQHSVVMLEQCCNYSKQYHNSVATLCCAKNRRCESFRVTSPYV